MKELWLVSFNVDFPDFDDYGNKIGYHSRKQYDTVYADTREEAIKQIKEINNMAGRKTWGYNAKTDFDHNLVEWG